MIVVADTSVLINLCCVGQGGLFRQLFQEVVIPPEVAAEFARLASGAQRRENRLSTAAAAMKRAGAVSA